MSKRFAIINKETGEVENVILWDGETKYDIDHDKVQLKEMKTDEEKKVDQTFRLSKKSNKFLDRNVVEEDEVVAVRDDIGGVITAEIEPSKGTVE